MIHRIVQFALRQRFLILMLTVIFLPRGLLPSLRILLRRILLRRAG